MRSFCVKVNNIITPVPYEPPEPWHRPKIQIIMYHQRDRPNVQCSALFEQPSLWMGQEIIAMSPPGKIRQKSEDLSFTTAPVPLRIDVQNLKPTPITACGQVGLSPLALVPKAWHT